jgi:hypothetical protein
MKIDVVCVSRDGPSREWMDRNLQRLPVNKLIIERSTPLLEARWRAIQRVETEWFLFLDDDVLLCDGWFEEALKYMRDERVGAIQGREFIYGFGEKWDSALNRFRWSKPDREYRLGDRGTCVNTLIRTEAVKDWNPPCLNLNAYEDFLITQHVIGKGYKWLDVRLPSWHRRGWKKHFTAALRDMHAMKQVEPLNRRILWLLKFCIAAILHLISPKPNFRSYGFRLRILLVYQNIACILGVLFT